MQEIIVYILVFAAAGFLVKTIFFPKKESSNCGTDCGCH